VPVIRQDAVGEDPHGIELQRLLNQPQSEAELTALRRSLQRNSAFGSDAWTTRTATALGLTSTLRPRGRPKQIEEE
jgi:hypothetical protein